MKVRISMTVEAAAIADVIYALETHPDFHGPPERSRYFFSVLRVNYFERQDD